MTHSSDLSGRRGANGRQELKGVMKLVRGLGSRCDFCGARALAVAVEVQDGGRQVAICRRCVSDAARRLPPLGGGDAA